MKKEETQKTEKSSSEQKENIEIDSKHDLEKNDDKEISKEKTFEEKVIELEDKLTRTFAEMENQRRRFEKEKEEAYEYGGFAFAKEALSLIDNFERR